MSVVATAAIAGDDDEDDRPSTGPEPAFVDALVTRLHHEHGVDPEELRRVAETALGTFAGARVQAFVPVLVEKRLRQACRDLTRGRAGAPVAQPRVG